MYKVFIFLCYFVMLILSNAEGSLTNWSSPIKGNHKLTYSYGYATHTCYGNFYNPNSEKGNPSCDTYALDFIPLPDSSDRVYAVEQGNVVLAKEQMDYGNTVVLHHGNGIYSRYAHLSYITSQIYVGADIKKGAIIGIIGNTTGGQGTVSKHLHFAMYKIGCKDDYGNINYNNCGELKTYPFKPEPLGDLINFPYGQNSGALLYGQNDKLTCLSNCGKIYSLTDKNISSEGGFNADFYLDMYPDLRRAFGDDHNAALTHWINTGIYEGRIASSEFDVKYYLDSYPDLQKAFGQDYKAALDHWINHGIFEGRQGSSVFHVRYYLNKYPDLQAEYGDNYLSIINHWKQQGIYEGRQGASDFDVRFYIENYTDLSNEFGTDYVAALMHWLKFGINEGRQGVP